MKIASVELESCMGVVFWSNRPSLEICGKWFSKTFVLPPGLLEVTFVVHSLPTPDRFAFSLHKNCGWIYSHEKKKKDLICCYDDFYRWLKRRGLKPGKIYYAEMWY